MRRLRRRRKRATKTARPTRGRRLAARKRRAPVGRATLIPVVGIGASAGGIEAFRRFFGTVPVDSGMAFVLVQHLDPNHESLAAEVIGRYTRMSVVQVRNDTPVKANRVYVIPPGKYLSIAGGTLRLITPIGPGGIRMSIDLFLRTLAADRQERAIGIVLSGTGTDGTLGLKAIKAAGGMSIAQDPASAQYDGMPSSAIAAGAVDQVLPPERISEAALAFLRHAYGKTGPQQPAEAEPAHDHLDDILAILRERAKFDFRSYKKSTLGRRIHRRMGLRRVDRIGDYVGLLTSEPAEVDALFDDLLIGVTSFFRDPDAWEVLQQHVLRSLVERKDAPTVFRAWVPGCATGEEAYSLAMVLIEAVQAAKKSCAVQIFASDVNPGALERARSGLYPESIAADVTAARLKRFFVPEEHSYRVVKELREMVAFAPQNLLADPPFSRLDLLSCRNLLMYLEPEAQGRTVSLLHFALAEGGLLFLGSADSIGAQDGTFEVVSKKWRIYRRVGPTRHDQVQFPAPALAVGPATGPPRVGRLAETVQRLLLERHGPACVVVNRKCEIVHYSGRTQDYLAQPAGPPTQDLFAQARDGVQAKLRKIVRRAMDENAPVTVSGAQVRRDGGIHRVRLTVEPLKGSRDTEGLLLICFADEGSSQSRVHPPDAGESEEPLVHQLQQELTATRGELQSTIEELQSSNQDLRVSNEEATSANEELQSTNEELQTSKEELQSVNEELNTVNAQLGSKVVELEQTNNDLDNLLLSTNVPTVFLDAQFHVRRFTPNATKLFSLIPSDVGRPIADVAQKYVDPDLLPDATAVLADLAPITREVDGKDGRRYIRQVLPYRTQDNRIDGVVLTFSDVAAEALHEARLYAEAIVDTMRESLLVLDADLHVQAANRSFYKTFGVSPEETVGHLLFEIGDRQWDIPRLRALLGEILPSRSVMSDFEVEHEFAKIGRRTMLLNARTLGEGGGRPELILVAIEDVTERRRAEEALQESEARGRAGVETAVDGVITIDEHGIVLSANPAAERMFGYTVAEVVGRNVKNLMSAPYRDAHDGYLASYRATGERKIIGIGREVAGRRKDGTIFPMDLAVSEFRGRAGRRFVGTVRDITARKQAEERLRLQQAELAHVLRIATMERLAAGLAHELNQPLGAIANGLEACAAFVRAGKSKPAKLLELLERAGTEALRAGEIVHRLREFVQRVEPRREPADLRELVRNATRWLLREMEQEHVMLRLHLGTHALPVLVDRIQIEQVFVNILQNAIDAIRETGSRRGEIEVQAGRGTKGSAEIVVHDTGGGLSPGALDRLFEPYFTTRAHGLGMGLAISRSIVEAHHGSLGVDPRTARTGVTVRLTLPLDPKKRGGNSHDGGPDRIRGR